jgi:hypothetical protein
MRSVLPPIFFVLSVVFAMAGEDAKLLRAVNLNGPALVVDGRAWEGRGAKDVELPGMAGFESQNIPLVPAVGDDVATMIRSSHWNSGGKNRIVVGGLPVGEVTVFLYVWEDNQPESFDIFVNGEPVLAGFRSGTAGHWERLGPWVTEVKNGKVELTSKGGAANWSGVEFWEGRLERHPGEKPPPPPKPVTEGALHFDKAVAPILSEHCLECHNPSEAKGDLDFTTAEGASEALVAGSLKKSELWRQVEDDEMPKKRPPLSEEEKGILRDWIAAGAEWGTRPVDPFLASTEHRAGYDWWSLQAVKEVAVPEVRDGSWARNEVDQFILSRLEEKGWKPSPEADRRTLLRRVTFDLTGLPPTPEELADFVGDGDPLAYEKVVDRLLASTAFGERWGRRWLDVVRFGESQGFERNRIRENAWRYRDWVIGAFNADLPYDEFLRLQIAGDVIYPDRLDAVIATGFHVCGTWDQVGHHEGSKAMQQVARQEHLEDLVATTSQAVLALTVNCARCHDHKFDPISHREYYQFAALLGGVNQQEKEREILLKGEGFGGIAHVLNPQQPPVFHVLSRGDVTQAGEVVSPAALGALAGMPGDLGLAPNAPEGQRRRRLAEWLTDPRNPLTARVFVNRIWQGVFGEGLVETPSDFGFNGGVPSDPELLDWLAKRLMERGWKSKDLIRLLVSSATYRQGSQSGNALARELDSGAKLRWRASMRRLEGEEVRDAMLAVSGALNRKLGGPSFRDVNVKLGNNHEFTDPNNEFNEDTCRRAIYRLWARSGSHPLLESLDCPDPSVMAPRRNRTITPLQALSLLNNPFSEECARRFAARIGEGDSKGQIVATYRFALLREPTEEELKLGQDFVRNEGLAQFCLVLFNTNEFLYLR